MRKVVETERMTLAQKQFDLPAMADLLNDAYLDTGRGPSDRAKKSFAPSSIGYGSGMCARRWFYDFQGGRIRVDDVDSVGVANMDYGTEAHARIQKLFEKTGILVEAERKVISEDPPVFGFADLIVNWQGEEVVGEIKTTSQESYVSKNSKKRPAGYHLLQVLIYMKVLGLNKGFLLYENKNNQSLLLLPVLWNAENTRIIDNAFEWMKRVRANWEADLLPKRPFTQKSIPCKSCPFSKLCWEDEEGVITIGRLEVPA